MPEITEETDDPAFSQDWSGFCARIDPTVLRRRNIWAEGLWRVEGVVAVGPQKYRTTLEPYWCGSGEYPPAHWVDQDVQVVPLFLDNALHLRVERAPVGITRIRQVEGGLEFQGFTRHGSAGGVLLLRHRQSSAVVDLSIRSADDHTFAVRVPSQLLAVDSPTDASESRINHWDLEIHHPRHGSSATLVRGHMAARDVQSPITGTRSVLYAKRLSDNRLQLCTLPTEAIVEHVEVRGTEFLLSGVFPHPGGGSAELLLRHMHGRRYRYPVKLADDGGFQIVLPLTVRGSDGYRRPLAKGIWDLLLRPVDGPDAERALLVSPALTHGLPARVHIGGKAMVLQRRWHDTLILDSTPDLPVTQRSAYRQRRLRTECYPAARRRPLRQAVLFDVFGGRGYADSPRAVHTELLRRDLTLEHLWTVEDGRPEPPAGVIPVRMWSPEWYEALATCRYLVGNTHFPEFIRRREGQQIVQLWHGTPLKRIGYEVNSRWLAEDGYLDRLGREVRQWSLLISPSPFATPVLRRSFGYHGEILESGYPRNDLLVRPPLGARAAIRRRLGLPVGKRVILYAPTWRDDLKSDGRHRLDLRLDLAAARAVLGDDHVLLVRMHAHVSDALPCIGRGFVFDVSDYPDVQDLLLIADILVTDYSSLMFDFAVTGRPMLFFTYDLEHYRDNLRGFTFDFEAEAPGPLVATSDELIAALLDLDATVSAHRARHQQFRERFCPLDDGNASTRVVDRILAL